MPSPLKKSFAAEQLRRQQRTSPTLVILLVVIGFIIVIGGAYVIKSRFLAVETPETEKEEIKSIAVLAFDDMSPNKDQEWFCDGIAEAILNALTHVEGLHVCARNSAFSFKGQHPDIREVGRKLNVETVLEGSVVKSDSKLRITTQLVNVADGFHIWSETYERETEDVFDLLEEISLAVVEELKVTLLDEEKTSITKRPTENQEAYELYLLGLHCMNMYVYDKALDHFQQAIGRDPDFALAYAEIAYVYCQMVRGSQPQDKLYPKAKAAAEKALQLDDNLPESHISAAWVSLTLDWDWDAAGDGFKKSIALNPGSAVAYQSYAFYLRVMGRFNESLVELEHAQKLDPVSLLLYHDLAVIHSVLGEYEIAMKHLQKEFELSPDDIERKSFELSWFYFFKKEYNNAFEAVKLGMENDKSFSDLNTWQLINYALSCEREKAEEILHQLIERKIKDPISFGIALLYAGLGENDKAFEWLDKAYEEHEYSIIRIKYLFINFETFRSDPRYNAFLQKMGLPED